MAATARGGGGRDVVFRLRIAADPKDLKSIKDFADEVAKAQKRFDETAAGAARKRLTDEEKFQRARLKQEDQVAKHHARTAIKMAEESRRVQHKAMAEAQAAVKAHEDWKVRVRANSVRLEYQENVRLARETEKIRVQSIRNAEREAIASARREARAVIATRVESHRRMTGRYRAAGGALELARGAAYSGLIGEDSSGKIINTLLAVEAGRSAYHGTREMAMGLGVSGTTMAASVAAIAAWLPAVTAGIKAIVTYAGSKPGQPGSTVGGAIGEGISGVYTPAMRPLPSGLLEFFMGKGRNEILSPYAQAELTRRRGESMIASSAQLRQQRAAMFENIRERGQYLGSAFSATRGGSDVQRARIENLFGQAATRDALSRTAGGAEEMGLMTRMLQLRRQARDLTVQEMRERLSGEQRSLEHAREVLALRTSAVESVRSDYARFAMLDPSKRAALKRVSGKAARGETLSVTEAGLAGEFSAFRDAAESSLVRRARAAGADVVFGDALTRSTAAERAAKEAVSKLEVTNKQQLEIIVKVEGETLSDATEQELIRKIEEIAKREAGAQGRKTIELVNDQLRRYGRAREPH